MSAKRDFKFQDLCRIYISISFLLHATYLDDFSKYDNPILQSSIFFTAMFDNPLIAICASPNSARIIAVF